MKRREFIAGSVASVGCAVAANSLNADATMASSPTASVGNEGTAKPFKLKYAPHFGMFQNLGGSDPVDQLKFAADQGFTAWEDNGMKGRDAAEQNRIGEALQKLGMTMGVFVGHGSFNQPTFTVKDKAVWDSVQRDISDSIEVAKRVHAKWMTVVPGSMDERGGGRQDIGYQTANAVELLRRCCEILESTDLVMVLEPLNWFANHGGLFLQGSPQAYLICKAVNHPSCKILFDIYHQQISEGNLIPNMDRCWDEIGYFQCGDNPGRNEPGTGEINYRNVFRHLHAKGFAGVVGMEHGNSKGGAEGEQAVIDAYAAADSF